MDVSLSLRKQLPKCFALEIWFKSLSLWTTPSSYYNCWSIANSARRENGEDKEKGRFSRASAAVITRLGFPQTTFCMFSISIVHLCYKNSISPCTSTCHMWHWKASKAYKRRGQNWLWCWQRLLKSPTSIFVPVARDHLETWTQFRTTFSNCTGFSKLRPSRCVHWLTATALSFATSNSSSSCLLFYGVLSATSQIPKNILYFVTELFIASCTFCKVKCNFLEI